MSRIEIKKISITEWKADAIVRAAGPIWHGGSGICARKNTLYACFFLEYPENFG